MPCSGDSTEACGGSDRISVFTNGVAAPVIDPGPRLLSYRAGVAAGDLKMSVLQCTNACQAAGYSLAGVEYSSECYCDSQLRNTGSSGFDGCNMLCSGNSSEYCGGPNRINVYQASAKPKSVSVMPSGWAEKGCLKDNVLGRALTVNVGVVGGTQNMFLHVFFDLVDDLNKPYFVIRLNHFELLYNFKVYNQFRSIIYLVHNKHYEQLIHEDFHNHHHSLFEYYCRQFVVFKDVIILVQLSCFS
ncbi:hypothetical protein SGCOL_000379 [Colletotrichum sp. CLE4]